MVGVIIDCAEYADGVRVAQPGTIEEAAAAARRDGSFVWLGLFQPSESEFEDVRKQFDLHELAAEDAVSAHQRPKLEVYDDTLLMVLKTGRYIDEQEEVEFGEIIVVAGPGFVVVVRHGEASSLAAVRRNLEGRPDLLRLGPSAVLHAIVDRVVDDYAPVQAGLSKDVDEVESEVFSTQATNTAERIYFLKREILEFQTATRSIMEPLERLMRGRVPVVVEDMHEYFRDVHDHTLRLNAQIDQHRDMLTSVLEANLTQVAVRQNEDMRRISAWVAIAVVRTLIAGIFGMNFSRMPGATAAWGFPVATAFMVVIAMALYRSFRKSGWL